MICGATLSTCGKYRYTLTRTWSDKPRGYFLLLNPSTADASKDDPTIRKCVGFAQRWGCGSIEVVNLFALRSTDPKALWANGYSGHLDAIGPDNDRELGRVVAEAERDGTQVVCGWGVHGGTRGTEIERRFRGKLQRIGPPTKDGNPRHPLYLKYETKLEPHP